ncbi:Uroporphyrinogen-III methyltransferase / Uroporphyrinogen-III synthase [Anaerovibrio sp. JC8]|uniref:uroporphyrinogen-III C-methyltransferase n=1 Tax=Anaerovibrio sp. JC8 TaxID=1240085 RepID=UPI000A0B579D|nr:uroporphyrinogen-III C-methyltransferase [Anaerovibrio sp. JC8]ORU01031.1 Uroporphyrinogen-III methyltransferase / Uroporphyrinogen-III synthase [Anaerovibrio sp. JC8]
MAGKVFLVGAGPGDYRLLTLKACDCLKIADTVVYDRLADPRILQYAPKDAEYIYVGKASSQHTMTQDKICQLLVDLAKEGKTVVRLKGGDPFVFGRGGEEALLLKENNLPFEIVPGVTSAISVPAYAGIPVTHRGVAASFSVITGHEDPTKETSDINWPQLAKATDTLVFLMGVANLPKITSKLIENGRSADTPIAIIRWGTKLQQQVWTSTLADAADMAKREAIKPPCIFLVGDVVNLRKDLAWFDNIAMKPLFGKKVLVTRSRAQASKLTAKLEDLGAECIEAPAIEIKAPSDGYKALDGAIAELNKYNWLIFTSANGVEHFWQRLQQAGKDARALAQAKLCAIGSATAEALQTRGLMADVVPDRYQAEGIIEALKGEIKEGTKVLIPRAAEAREILPDTLRKAGAEVDVVTAYETVMGEVAAEDIKQALTDGQIDAITFTSSSTVINFLKLIGNDTSLLKQAKLAAIGPITADTMKKHGLAVSVEAEEYTIDGLVEALKEAF